MVVVLKLTGFVHSATTRDIKDLFRGLRIGEEDIHIGRDKGFPVGFSVFSDDDEARRATTRSGQTIGPRRVTISLSSSAEMDAVLNRKQFGQSPRGSSPPRGRGIFRSGPPYRGRGRGRGRGIGFPRFSDRSDRDFDTRPSRGIQREERSSFAPVFRVGRGRGGRGSGLDEIGKRPVSRGDTDEYSDRKYIKAAALPYVVTELDLQDFFRGILTRDVYLCRHESGRFEGRPNGEAIIEFFSEQDAREALERDGKRMGPRVVTVYRPKRDEIKEGIRLARQVERREEKEIPSLFGQDHGLFGQAVPRNRDQLHNLLELLKTAISQVGDEPPIEPPHTPIKPPARRESGEDPVIRRVARNANINMKDIGDGRVVGIRNLPFSVTPDDVISFFRGYAAIPDSVRIHYSEDGRSSGDAIITFRTRRDADRAVTSLNKKFVGKRKVELFIM